MTMKNDPHRVCGNTPEGNSRCSEFDPRKWQYNNPTLLIHFPKQLIEVIECEWTDGAGHQKVLYKPKRILSVIYDSNKQAKRIEYHPTIIDNHVWELTDDMYLQAWAYESEIITYRLEAGMSITDIAEEAVETVLQV